MGEQRKALHGAESEGESRSPRPSHQSGSGATRQETLNVATRERGHDYGQGEWIPWRPPVCRRENCCKPALDYTFQLCAGCFAEYMHTKPGAPLTASPQHVPRSLGPWPRGLTGHVATLATCTSSGTARTADGGPWPREAQAD